MKKISVILLVVFSFVFAGLAEAAKPKKRTRNANRIGPYAGALVGYSTFSADDSASNEIALRNTLINTNSEVADLSSDSEDTDLGYQAMFGFRFHRYFAAELGLAQFGSSSSTARANLDFGQGFIPVSVKISYSVGGPMISGIGILPLHEKFELFGRLGYLFSSSELEFTSNVDGERGSFGSAKGDSQDLAYGVGFSWNISQVYAIRGEFQKMDSLGQETRTGEEDVTVLGLGFIVRF